MFPICLGQRRGAVRVSTLYSLTDEFDPSTVSKSLVVRQEKPAATGEPFYRPYGVTRIAGITEAGVSP